jgi:hypothetical protein
MSKHENLRWLSGVLDSNGLSMEIHNASETSWVVWVYSKHDPGGVGIGEDDDLIEAIKLALEDVLDEPPEAPGEPPN